jgi:hypothetical protein
MQHVTDAVAKGLGFLGEETHAGIELPVLQMLARLEQRVGQSGQLDASQLHRHTCDALSVGIQLFTSQELHDVRLRPTRSAEPCRSDAYRFTR